jgi:carbon storage regulator
MLVLSRKKQESIVIGGGITITVLDCEGSRVRLGITAPAEVKVLRLELLLDQKTPPSKQGNAA